MNNQNNFFMRVFIKGLLYVLGNLFFTLVITSLINFVLSIVFMSDFKDLQQSPIWVFSAIYFVISSAFIVNSVSENN
jgi:hypothetical protein